MIQINNSIAKAISPKLFGVRLKAAVQKHAEKCYPEECCGLVVKKKYIPCENIHCEPEAHWKIDDNDIVKASKKGTLEAIIHSHPFKSDLTNVHSFVKNDEVRLPWAPSVHDMETQLAYAIPFGIIIVNEVGAGEIIWFGDQVKDLGYEGRPFISGVYDCWTLIRSYYKKEYDIVLLNYPHYPIATNKKAKNNRPFMRKAGFKMIKQKDLQPGDLIGYKFGRYAQHIAIYTGGDQILHQIQNQLSCFESAGRMVKFIDSCWRYKDK